ncbi:hypothetical protein Q4E93_20735 [Flavitalea sp. BT771]|uniref:hypothetical protein n=1 Tax=Flavitalea sp. BT771 TaxID=3063329 RepID=UPI0026E32373|nr:hypothetical protein [Flavitalea sp. BT771]MDO6433047.1 hypothetical protein [Flavitalea sp. BT771]MDV6221677.1 hypothetical protein [Flavitalea sp. BT771]
MKIFILITICICCLGIGAYCQTFSEWFFQKKTRIRRLQQQIAALETLSATLKKGYALAEQGVDSVRIPEREGLVMDDDFLTHLRTVKPAFKYGAEVVSCHELVRVMEKRLERWSETYAQSPWLKPRESDLICGVMTGIIKTANYRLDHLHQLISDDQMEMEDGARWDAIKEAEVDIRATYELSNRCIAASGHLIEFREQQAANDAYLKSILQ